MPYYCTVPRCTSMAGKDKNVSFHQFPRDEELADLWNNVLKRGKPYTKYSKVCSLHFKPEDYTITSVGKNKGQWRTLRKDAVPTQNLPSDSPITPQRSRSSTQWQTPTTANIIDPRIHQQVAQAIYMQTMLAMQAAGVSDPATLGSGFNGTSQSSSDSQPTSTQILPLDITELQRVLQKHQQIASQQRDDPNDPKDNTFQCQECSKCFKDPDVFQLHKRIHKVKHEPNNGNEKENVNNDGRLATLKANPILFNLLKAGVPNGSAEEETSNVMSIENQMITALSANMENYLRNLSTMLTNTDNNDEISNDAEPVCDKKDLNESMDSNNLVIDESV